MLLMCVLAVQGLAGGVERLEDGLISALLILRVSRGRIGFRRGDKPQAHLPVSCSASVVCGGCETRLGSFLIPPTVGVVGLDWYALVCKVFRRGDKLQAHLPVSCFAIMVFGGCETRLGSFLIPPTVGVVGLGWYSLVCKVFRRGDKPQAHLPVSCFASVVFGGCVTRLGSLLIHPTVSLDSLMRGLRRCVGLAL